MLRHLLLVEARAVYVSSLRVKAVAVVRQPVELCHYALYKICFASHSIIIRRNCGLSLVNALSPGEAASLGTIAYKAE